MYIKYIIWSRSNIILEIGRFNNLLKTDLYQKKKKKDRPEVARTVN